MAIKNQGTVASASGAHGITLTVLDDDRHRGPDADRLVHRHDRGRRHDQPGQPGHLDGGQRQVHRPDGRSPSTPTSCRSSRPTTPPTSRSSSAAAPTCRTTCTRPRTARSAAARRSSARTGPSATWPARRPAAGRSPSTRPARTSQWTTRASTNTLVTRFSIPDGSDQLDAEHLRQRHVPQGDRPDLEVRLAVRRRDRPEQLAGRGRPAAHLRRGQRHARHDASRPAARSGCRRTPANTAHVRDRLHQPRAGVADRQPGPGQVRRAGRLHPAGRAERARHGPAGHHRSVGVYLPAGDYQTSSKFQVYGKAVKVVGAGPWYTRFHDPAGAGEHRRRLPGRATRPTARRSPTSPTSATTPSASTARARSGRLRQRVEHDDRQHLGRAHGLHVLGRQHRQHDDHELAGSATRSPTAST